MNLALNAQMEKEFQSSYQYLAITSHFLDEELEGFANFFRIQAQEEMIHASKIYDFIHDAGGSVKLAPINAPKQDFTTIREIFDFALEQERTLSREIHKLCEMASQENDHATSVFLQWFVREQMEEENLFKTSVKRVGLAGEDGAGLLFLDQEFANRSLPPAADNEAQ